MVNDVQQKALILMTFWLGSPQVHENVFHCNPMYYSPTVFQSYLSLASTVICKGKLNV